MPDKKIYQIRKFYDRRPTITIPTRFHLGCFACGDLQRFALEEGMSSKKRASLILMAIFNGISLANGLKTETYTFLVFTIQSLSIVCFISTAQD